MTTPVIEVSPDAPILATYVAERFIERLVSAQADGAAPQVALTGGTIANAIYAEVARLGPDSAVDWSRVVFWWGDERFVPDASPDRNAGQARRAFLDALPIPPENIHPMPSSDDTASPDDGAATYGDLMRSFGSGEFEIVLLGVGPDGHVASLFPGFPQLDRDDAIALGVYDSPKPPPERITLTLPALNRAKEVWFLASGPEKAHAVATAYSKSQSLGETSLPVSETSLPAGEESLPVADTSLPAARVPGRVRTIWLLDESAASGIG